LRPKWKFIDNSTVALSLSIFQKKITPSDTVMALAPPSYRACLSAVNSHDPLRVDIIHTSESRLRRVVQSSKVLQASQEATGLDEAIQFLQKAQRLAKQGYNCVDEEWADAWWDNTGQAV